MDVIKWANVGIKFVILFIMRFFLQYLYFNVLTFVTVIWVFFVVFVFINLSHTIDFSSLEVFVFKNIAGLESEDTHIDLVPIIAKGISAISFILTGLSIIGGYIYKFFTRKDVFIRIDSVYNRIFMVLSITFLAAILSAFLPNVRIENFWLFMGILTGFFLVQLGAFYVLMIFQGLVSLFGMMEVPIEA